MIHSFHIIGSSGSGGAERFFVRLVHGLRDAGTRVTAISRPNSAVSTMLDPQIPQLPVALRNVIDLPSRWRIRSLVKRQRPQIVQTYMGRATRLTHIESLQGTIHVARLGGYYDLKGYRHAQAWIANTKGIRDYLVAQGFAGDRVFYLPNFVEPVVEPGAGKVARLRRQLGLPDDALVVMALGRMVAKKGFNELLQAFAGLPEQIGQRPVHLLLLGDGPLQEELQQQALQMSITQRVVWAGWCPDPTDYFHLANVFVCPSRHEPLGNVILEAWSHGLPVISTDTQGAQELIQPGEDGLVVPVGDVDRLGNAMNVLLTDPEQGVSLAQNGGAKVQRQFSPDTVIQQYLDTYEQLLRRFSG